MNCIVKKIMKTWFGKEKTKKTLTKKTSIFEYVSLHVTAIWFTIFLSVLLQYLDHFTSVTCFHAKMPKVLVFVRKTWCVSRHSIIIILNEKKNYGIYKLLYVREICTLLLPYCLPFSLTLNSHLFRYFYLSHIHFRSHSRSNSLFTYVLTYTLYS